MLLLVGPSGSGKTRFSKQLQEYLSTGHVVCEADLQPTVPTVGTNMTTLHFSRKDTVEMRELGGSMAPIWKKYYKESNAIIFLANKNGSLQLSACFILLMDMLTREELKEVPFLIVWNKIDCENCMTDGFIKNILDLELIAKHAKQSIQTLNCSSITGKGLADIAGWIQQVTFS
ncbi:ADP-ribosylation factor-like protein 16 [Watersipora subatra]|uniref:ADP-ribosylation factor-like protein 16 n=1 Tax=Watersipora subatra TaxID=2589382 RepID=UPI00355B37E5